MVIQIQERMRDFWGTLGNRWAPVLLNEANFDIFLASERTVKIGLLTEPFKNFTEMFHFKRTIFFQTYQDFLPLLSSRRFFDEHFWHLLARAQVMFHSSFS